MPLDDKTHQRISESYEHRSSENPVEDLDAAEILEGYLRSNKISSNDDIDFKFPYHGVLGRTAEQKAEVLSVTHYIKPVEDSYRHSATGKLSTTDNLASRIESQVDEDSLIDAAGFQTERSSYLSTPSGDEIVPDDAYCLVFYDEPSMTTGELKHRMDFDDMVHKSVALEAVKNPVLGTAIISSGRKKSSMQVDYWPEGVDSLVENYGSLDWNDPAPDI
ncbi:MAG: hypothetical protein ABEK10_01435 [Candidatus Nanosalina sp.]